MQNFALQEEIVQKGLLISEYLPDTPPRPYRFPERNRILAGLSQSVIVTEAKEKSGSLITANLALQEIAIFMQYLDQLLMHCLQVPIN